MSRHTGHPSSQSDAPSNEIQLAVLKQKNRHLKDAIKSFEITKFRNTDELYPILHPTRQLNNHYFGFDQQWLLSI